MKRAGSVNDPGDLAVARHEVQQRHFHDHSQTLTKRGYEKDLEKEGLMISVGDCMLRCYIQAFLFAMLSSVRVV